MRLIGKQAPMFHLSYVMNTPFQSYKELFDFTRELRDALAKKGKVKEAQELTELLNGYWSTDSEVLGNFLISFNSVKNTVINNLSDKNIERLDLTIEQIKEAFDRSNNPS